MNSLEALKALYKEKFNIDGPLVDLMSNRDILQLTASGTSFNSVSRFLDIELEEVKLVNRDFFGFDGWDVDLDLNPLAIYTNMTNLHYFTYEVFANEIKTISPYFTDEVLEKMYDVCTKFYTLDKLLEEAWI